MSIISELLASLGRQPTNAEMTAYFDRKQLVPGAWVIVRIVTGADAMGIDGCDGVITHVDETARRPYRVAVTTPRGRRVVALAAADILPVPPPCCRQCGCTDDDCSGCVERTGRPCHWVGADLCSACVPEAS